MALSKALAEAKQRGAKVGAPVTLAKLVESDGSLTLTPDGPDPLATVVADVCRGRQWPSEPADLLGADQFELQQVQQRVIESAMSKALVDGRIDPNLKSSDLEHMRQRSALAEDRLAQRLGISRDRLAAVSFRAWKGRTFSEERDQRADPQAGQQKRGRISRELRAELEKELANGDD